MVLIGKRDGHSGRSGLVGYLVSGNEVDKVSKGILFTNSCICGDLFIHYHHRRHRVRPEP
jgi:hypothetical protein